MATQFSDLQKLLINVKFDKCDAFINAHINDTWPITETEDNPRPSTLPEFNYDETDTYYNKVVFLQKYNTIYTKGTFFGYNGDLKESFDDLFNGLTKGISANGITVKYNPDATDGPAIETTVIAATYSNKTWNDPDNVVTGSTVKTYVDEQVASAVAEATAAMEFKDSINSALELQRTESTANNGDVYVVGTEFTVGTGDNAKLYEAGDLIIFRKNGLVTSHIVVQKNLDGAVVKDKNWKGIIQENDAKVALVYGLNTVKPSSYVIGSDTTTYTAFGTTTYTLATEAATSAYVVGKLGELDASVTYNANVNNYVSYSYTQTDGLVSDVTVGLKVAEYTYTAGSEGTPSTFTYNTYGLIDHEILNNYMSYVSDAIGALDMDHSITTLTEVDNDYLKVSDSAADDSNDHNYTVGLKVVSLSNAVGMTYDEESGKWVAPADSSATDGLASAADVANELVSDEKVIAAALNDHEARIDALEDFVGDINGTIQDQLVIGEVTVDGLIATKTNDGLVNADLLVSVINALDPWEEYTGE